MNTSKTPSYITKPQKTTVKTNEFNFENQRATSPINFTSKKNDQDIFNNLGKIQNTNKVDNDVLNNLLNDLGNNPVTTNTNNSKSINNMYNIKPINNNPNTLANNSNFGGYVNNNNNNFMRNSIILFI